MIFFQSYFFDNNIFFHKKNFHTLVINIIIYLKNVFKITNEFFLVSSVFVITKFSKKN